MSTLDETAGELEAARTGLSEAEAALETAKAKAVDAPTDANFTAIGRASSALDRARARVEIAERRHARAIDDERAAELARAREALADAEHRGSSDTLLCTIAPGVRRLVELEQEAGKLVASMLDALKLQHLASREAAQLAARIGVVPRARALARELLESIVAIAIRDARRAMGRRDADQVGSWLSPAPSIITSAMPTLHAAEVVVKSRGAAMVRSPAAARDSALPLVSAKG